MRVIEEKERSLAESLLCCALNDGLIYNASFISHNNTRMNHLTVRINKGTKNLRNLPKITQLVRDRNKDFHLGFSGNKFQLVFCVLCTN